MSNNENYDDIINMKHHESKKRARMSMYDRAAQFSPFSALSGYSEAIRETGRITEEKVDMSEEKIFIINETLNIIKNCINKRPLVKVVCYVPDLLKEGGEYITFSKNVKRIDEINKILIMTDETKISFDDISELEIL